MDLDRRFYKCTGMGYVLVRYSGKIHDEHDNQETAQRDQHININYVLT